MRSVSGLAGAALLLVAASAGDAAAQVDPLTLEIRTGAGVPLEEFSEAGTGWTGAAGEGFSFGVGFTYALRWWLAPYAGFSQMRFACPAAGCGRSTDLVSTGFDVGVLLRLTGPRVAPWIRLGALSYRVEGRAPVVSESRDVVSDRTLGYETGAGLTIRVRPGVFLSPGIRYARMTPSFPGPGPLRMRYLVADLGFVIGF